MDQAAAITVQSASIFLAQFGLIGDALLKVTAAITGRELSQTIGLSVLANLYPKLTHWPGSEDYEQIKEGHW